MWINSKSRERTGPNEPQTAAGLKAPAPHITVTILIVIIIIIIIPSFALSFISCVTVAKTTACYLRSDQCVLAEGLLNSHNRLHIWMKCCRCEHSFAD